MDSLFAAPLLTFPDFQAGAGYVARLPLANPAAAEEQIGQLLDSLLAAPPDQGDLLALLEELRSPLALVAGEMGRRYHGKPLVLGEMEEKAFQRVVLTWRKLRKAYARCLAGVKAVAGDAEAECRLAALLHRCLHCTGAIILEHYRARRELPPGLWRELHAYYRAAEDRGIATLAVEDGIAGEDRMTHCAAAYGAILLADLAGPYSRSVRDIDLIGRWAALWAPLVRLLPEEGGGKRLHYVLELDGDSGLHPADPASPPRAGVRCLDTSSLARQVKEVLEQLRQKMPASRLGLGDEPSSHARGLLEQLVRPWSQAGAARKFRRFAASGTARVCVGFESIHFFVSGRPFEQPEVAKTYSRGEFNLLFSARELAVPGQRPVIRSQDDYPADQWEVVNHSANGFRLARTSVGQKMGHSQLLALCPHDGERFLLARASWLMQDRGGGLVAGVSVLPGLPTGVAVRIGGEPRDSGRPFVRGFVLSPVANVAEHGSIVLPLGTYQASRIFDIYADGFWQVRLKNILERGSDFERVSFETV